MLHPKLNNMAIINHDMTIEEAWEEVLEQLNEAANNAGHPLRYLSLATVGKENQPSQRTVVLRDFKHNSLFTVFTDARSKKVEDLRNNDSCSLLFYDSEQQLQVTVKGQASVITEGIENLKQWKKSGSKGAHSYTSVKSPGEIIDKPDNAYDWDLENPEHFCMIHIEARSIEFLQLDGHRHLRSTRTLSDGSWEREWIAP
jgi:pyridoxine/pyridoxamine 5'-phosphate oxidase